MNMEMMAGHLHFYNMGGDEVLNEPRQSEEISRLVNPHIQRIHRVGRNNSMERNDIVLQVLNVILQMFKAFYG